MSGRFPRSFRGRNNILRIRTQYRPDGLFQRRLSLPSGSTLGVGDLRSVVSSTGYSLWSTRRIPFASDNADAFTVQQHSTDARQARRCNGSVLKGVLNYINPQFHMIGDVVRKVLEYGAESILVLPYWPSQPW